MLVKNHPMVLVFSCTTYLPRLYEAASKGAARFLARIRRQRPNLRASPLDHPLEPECAPLPSGA